MGISPTNDRRYEPSRSPGERNRHSASKATRHLCAGVYVDRSFRDRVIRKVHNDPRRRVAPSYGFDLVPVVRHAWLSWLLEMGQMAVTAGVLCAAITRSHWLAIVFVVAVILACCVLHKTLPALPGVVRRKVSTLAETWLGPGQLLWPRRRRRSRRGYRRVARSVLIVFGVPAAILALAARVDEDSVGEAARRATAMAVLLAVFALLAGALRQLDLNTIHRAETLRPAKLTPRERIIDEQQSYHCVVYRSPKGSDDVDPYDLLDDDHGMHSPFVGSGSLVGYWPAPLIVQLLRRGPENIEEREYTTPPFEAHQLIDRLRASLAQVGSESQRGNLRGLEVRDRLYISETDISTDRLLLRSALSQQLLWSIVDDPEAPAHHFLETSVPLEGGELVVTVFARVTVKARNLGLSVAACELTRTPSKFRRIDEFAEHGWGAVGRSALRAVLRFPVEVWNLWRLAEVPLFLARAAWAAKDRTLVPRRGVVIGTRIAVRQEAVESQLNRSDKDAIAFDRNTINGHVRMIEQRIIKTTEGFLKDHDVDTSSFEKQATTIINSGVLTMGGKTEVSQSAVGDRAQIHRHTDGDGASGEDA